MKFLKSRNGKPYFYVEPKDIDASHGFTEQEIKEIMALKVRQVWTYKETRPGYGKDVLTYKRVK